MPQMLIPKFSMSSDDTDDAPFKVLNQDNLPAITVVGETIFKPFGNDPKIKPNLIVHPIRRNNNTNNNNLEENKNKIYAKSQGNISNNKNKSNKNLKKKFSQSHGQLNHNNSTSGIKLEELLENHQQIDSKFTRTLDAKLRRLQREENNKQQTTNKKISSPQNFAGAKKPFVTTVAKGTFLDPPPECEKLFFKELKTLKNDDKTNNKKEDEKKLFTYASQPRVLNRVPFKNVHMQKCAAALAAAKITGGVAGLISDNTVEANSKEILHQETNYGNIMSDKRVYRGSNFSQTHIPSKWNPNFVYAKLLSRDDGDGESGAARAAEARRRALARRKAKNQHYKSGQLRLGSPPPVSGRRHENIQTETYLEEIYVNPPVTDECTQTDLFVERPVSPFYVPAKTGADIETQIYPGDLFDFDMEVQPILEVLVGKTVEQALIEVLEEEELAALREQQRRFLELRATETAEALRLEEREKRLVKEKERRFKEHDEGVKLQKEMEERIAAAVLMQGYMADLLPSVLEGLESEGFMMDNIREDIDESFMPWLIKEVTLEIQDMVCSRDVLSDIVREILENRAELYKALNKETSTDETEEEGPSIEDMMLQDHLRLQEEIKKREQNLNKEIIDEEANKAEIN